MSLEPDFDEIARLIAEGYLSQQPHPSENYRILNYTQKTQYEWFWTPETKTCRGLIVDDQNQVVARPFEKFFSYEQLDCQVPDESFEVYDKLDGSLGILYQDRRGQPQIASRGSFTSQQAERGTAVLHAKYGHVQFDPDLTYLFEIIYPENRIVVDYGKTEDLILLAVIETQSGRERPLEDIGLPMVKRYHGINDFSEVVAQQDDSREGMVVRFEGGMRVKFKFEEYKRLHKVLTGISVAHIWQTLASGKSLDDLVEQVPDEFFSWVREVESTLKRQFRSILDEAHEQYNQAPSFETRKQAAAYFKQCRYPSLMFAILDNKPHEDKVWRLVKPSGHQAFRIDSEA